jgi:hypothetical protein
LPSTTQALFISTLLDNGWTIYPVNPKTVDRRHNAANAKTDRIDAYLLTKTGRSDLADLRRLTPDSPIVAELKELTRDQDNLVQMQTRLVNQLTACLKAYYPVALELLILLQQTSTLRLLQAYPTPNAAKAATLEELTTVFKLVGHKRAAIFAPRIYQKLQEPQLVANEITVRTKSPFDDRVSGATVTACRTDCGLG